MPTKSPGDAEACSHHDPDRNLAPVIRLLPIRTLVVSRDLDYRARAVTVLSQLGPVVFVVAAADDPDAVAGLLLEHDAHVVVLDATGCEDAVRAVIDALAASAPRTGVVVVCHHCSTAARRLRALPKWGWTQDLRAAVELAYRAGSRRHRPCLSPPPASPPPRSAGPLLRP